MELLSFISGAAGGVLTFYYFHRKIQVENILQERTKWRERIRELASEIATNPKPKDIAELRLRLNPNDDNDNKIIDLAESLKRNSNYFSRKSFLTKVAHLLKHDWERAKLDTEILGFFQKIDEDEIRNGFYSVTRRKIRFYKIIIFVALISMLLPFFFQYADYHKNMVNYYCSNSGFVEYWKCFFVKLLDLIGLNQWL